MHGNNKNGPLVAIIILNFNNYNDTIECLESLNETDYDNKHVIVINNGSLNNSFDILKMKFPGLHLLDSEVNLGFTGGCNLGLKEARKLNADYYLLLNNDTVVEKRFLSELISSSKKEPRAGLLSPVEYFYSDRDKINFSGGYISAFRGPRYSLPYSKRRLDDNSPAKTSLLGGSCVLIKKQLIEEIGELDENYFLYYEDADFCVRALRSDWDLMIVPKSRIWHKGGSASREDADKMLVYYLNRNLLYFATKYFTSKPSRYLFYFSFYFAKVFLFMRWFLQLRFDLIGSALKGISAFYKGKMGRGKL